MRTKGTIISEINVLLEELSGPSNTVGTKSRGARSTSGGSGKTERYSGCMGGINYLKDEEFFVSPRSSKEVIDALAKEGRYYPPQLVAMNLLNLTRQRVLTRIPDGKKGWRYVVRK